MSRSRRTSLALAWIAATVVVAACGGALESPPIELSFRESMLGAGKIVQIQNTSDKPLESLVVTITDPAGDSRTFHHANLAGFDMLEVGWKKLDGWQIPPGADVRIKAEGYLLAFEATLPEAESAE